MLEVFEIVICTVDLIGVFRQSIDFLNDGEFLLVVLLTLLFKRGCCSSTFLADDSHLLLELTFLKVGRRSVFLGIASFFDELLVGRICFLVVDAVEVALEAVEFLASHLFVTCGKFLESSNNLGLGLISGERSC